jgi:hypothetical protein
MIFGKEREGFCRMTFFIVWTGEMIRFKDAPHLALISARLREFDGIAKELKITCDLIG